MAVAEPPGHSGHDCCGDTDSDGGVMLHMCLAVTVAVMALGALRPWNRVSDLRRHIRAVGITLGGATLRAPPWLRPCLYSLRVLRL